MAGAKETPRQKMIGMMYLVLTAILALNVSKEILDAFVLVNDALGATNENFRSKTESQYAAFDNAKLLDEKKVRPNWEKARKIREESALFLEYISGMKKELVRETEGLTPEQADTIYLGNVEKKDDSNVPNYIMIGNSEDGSAGKAGELKNKIAAYRKFLESFIDEKDKDLVKISLNTNDPVQNQNNENWELYNFYNVPLAGIVTNLSCIENQIRKAESDVVEYLFKKVWDADVRFDTIAAKVIAPSSYVLLGDEYNAEVFLAAYNKTKNPQVLVGELTADGNGFNGSVDSIEVKSGTGMYKMKTTKEGLVKWGGQIVMTNSKGERRKYPFKSEYMVARPSATVSPTMMNVVYMGVPNPLSVSCPGVAGADVTVVPDQGNIVRSANGEFNVTPGRVGQMKVNVYAKINGETRTMGNITLRVMPLPSPIPGIGGKTTPLITKNELLAAYGPMAVYPEDFVYKNISAKVKSFKLSALLNGVPVTETSDNGLMTERMKDLIRRAGRTGTIFYFEEVKMVGPDGAPKTGNFFMKICN
ncbi:MAG: gliding motility protein GldM [Bacteroidia bacterium]|nr:gliding motility protein GldM [Bacteroidia bacterium]